MISKRKSLQISTLLILCSITATSNAQSSNWWAAIEGGYAFSVNESDSVTKVMPNVNLPDIYRTNDIDNRGVLGIGVGYQFILNQPLVYKDQIVEQNAWFPSNRVGLMYDYYFNADVSGHIDKWETVRAYDFSYVTHSNTFWLIDQLDLFTYNNFIPFIEVGIGDALNKTYGYSESALSVVPEQDIREDAAFQSRTKNCFAWRAGLGVNMMLPHNWVVGLMYRYSNLGTAETGSSAQIDMQGGLHEKLRNNELLATVRYDFGG